MKVIRTRPGARLPTRGSKLASGFDLYACIESNDGIGVIPPRHTAVIDTGLVIAIPDDWTGLLLPRSSASLKGLSICNVIDPDYRGEVRIIVRNNSPDTVFMKHQERVAQLVLVPRYTAPVVEVDHLDETERGDGGFGSTGQ